MPALTANRTTILSLSIGDRISITGVGAWRFNAFDSGGLELDSGSYSDPDVIGPFQETATVNITPALGALLSYDTLPAAVGSATFDAQGRLLGADGGVVLDVGAAQAISAGGWRRFAPRLSFWMQGLRTHDGVLSIIGDSTGNADDEVFYRFLAERLGPAIPDLCIVYRRYDNATGTYGAPTQIQAGAGQRFARFVGNSRRSILASQIQARASQDLEIEVSLSLDDWTPASSRNLFGRSGASGNRGAFLQVKSTGALSFQWSPDGTTLIDVSAANPGWADGTVHRIKATLDADNGAGGYTVIISTSDDDGQTWTVRQTTATSAGATQVFATTANLDIGAVNDSNGITGSIYDVAWRDGINGPNLAPASIAEFGVVSSAMSPNVLNGGGRTLYVFNGSVAGQSLTDFDTASEVSKRCGRGMVSAVIVNTGHNEISNHGPDAYAAKWASFVTKLRARNPTAVIAATNENPRNFSQVNGAAYGIEHHMRVHSVAGVFQSVNIELIDTYSSFSGADISVVVADGLHPTVPQGVNLMIAGLGYSIGL